MVDGAEGTLEGLIGLISSRRQIKQISTRWRARNTFIGATSPDWLVDTAERGCCTRKTGVMSKIKPVRERMPRRRSSKLAGAMMSLTAALCLLLFTDSDMPRDDGGSNSALRTVRCIRGFISRHLTERIIKTPYVLVEDVVWTMPRIVPPPERSRPSHVALCEEFAHRTALTGSTPAPFMVEEDPAMCGDWGAPHHAIMEILASSLVATVGSSMGLRYAHGCHGTLPSENDGREYDYTSVQQLLPAQLIFDVQEAALGKKEVEELCKGCVHEYLTAPLPEYGYSGTSRHCLLYPGGTDAISEFAPPSPPVLATILPTAIHLLQNFAVDHLHRTHPMEDESTAGAIIFLDDTSTPMNYSVYERYLPTDLKTIQIFASASCASNAIHYGNDCIVNGGRIKRYFLSHRSKEYGTRVRYDVVASTATTYARMIHARILICPPRSVSCYLPALAKIPGTSAVVAESVSDNRAGNWLAHILEVRGGSFSHAIELVELSDAEQEMPTGSFWSDEGNLASEDIVAGNGEQVVSNAEDSRSSGSDVRMETTQGIDVGEANLDVGLELGEVSSEMHLKMPIEPGSDTHQTMPLETNIVMYQTVPSEAVKSGLAGSARGVNLPSLEEVENNLGSEKDDTAEVNAGGG